MTWTIFRGPRGVQAIEVRLYFSLLSQKIDNLHEMSKPIFWEKNKEKIINLSFAEVAQRGVNAIYAIIPHLKFTYKIPVGLRVIFCTVSLWQ